MLATVHPTKLARGGGALQQAAPTELNNVFQIILRVLRWKRLEPVSAQLKHTVPTVRSNAAPTIGLPGTLTFAAAAWRPFEWNANITARHQSARRRPR